MPTISPAALWTGRILSGLVLAFVLFDGALRMLLPFRGVHPT